MTVYSAQTRQEVHFCNDVRKPWIKRMYIIDKVLLYDIVTIQLLQVNEFTNFNFILMLAIILVSCTTYVFCPWICILFKLCHTVMF